MLPSKSKSGLSEAANNKTTPPTPKSSRLSRSGSTRSVLDSPSPHHNPCVPVDRSPGSADSKPGVERRSPKVASRIGTPPDKQSRASKPSELQAQLTSAQDDLKKAKDQLALVEKEKSQALEELKDAKALADKANEKLQESIAAQKRTQEALEIEKFQALESEQASLESAKKKEEEWQSKLESIRKQHAVDAAALQLVVQELERTKHELGEVVDAKTSARHHVNDAMKIAKANTERAELLAAEVSHLKSLLDTEADNRSKEAMVLIKKLESEATVLKLELEKARAADKKLGKLEMLVEELRTEVANARKAEFNAGQSADQWKQEADLFEIRLVELYESSKSKADSLAAVMHELDVAKALLRDKDSEITILKNRVTTSEHELAQYKEDSNVCSQRIDVAQKEALELHAIVEDLSFRLQIAQEEKLEAVDNEKIAYSKMESLSDDKDILMKEMEASKDEGEKDKRAMADLASALHEVTAEVREAQEKFLAKQAEIGIAQARIEELNLALKNSKENYEVMLDEANYGRVCLEKTVERLEVEAKNSMDEWRTKEVGFVSLIRKSEEEISTIKAQMDGVVESLRGTEHELQAAKEKNSKLQDKLSQLETEIAGANRAAEKAHPESSRSKERLLDRENELKKIMQEKKDMQIQESTSFTKITKLSALLQEATAKKDEVDSALLSSEGCDLPKLICSLVKNADEVPEDKFEGGHKEIAYPEENGNKYADEEEPVMAVAKMWEAGKVVDHGLSKERNDDTESAEDDLESSMDVSSIDQKTQSSEKTNNVTELPTKQQNQQQKKQPLLKKFGGLLKKKSHH